MNSRTIQVHEITHEALAESGYEVGDNGAGDRELYASLVRRNLMSRLTPMQKRLMICLSEEDMTRRDAARRLMVSLQAVHQMVGRIKERFPEEDERRVRNLVWFFWLIYPTTNVRVISQAWYRHPVLRDYPKTDDTVLAHWFERYHIGSN